jgi:hypothetical protein
MGKAFFLSALIILAFSSALYLIANQKSNSELAQAQLKLADLMKIHTAYHQQKPLEFIRLGKEYDGGYVVPLLALEASDALIGYGIRYDISFEEEFSDLYHRPSYGFDCGLGVKIAPKNKLFKFIDQCIGTDRSVESIMEGSNGKISSFKTQLSDLKLLDKKVFVKMDIEGGEYQSLDEVLNYSQMITGLAIEFHIFNHDLTLYNKTIELMEKLNKDFVLLHVHGCNCTDSYFEPDNAEGKVPTVFEVTYINKFLIDRDEVSSDQTFPKKIDMPCRQGKPEFSFEFKS